MGGKNNFLGIAYIVVGGLCIVLGVFFTVAHLIKPRFVRPSATLTARSLTYTGNWVIILTFHGTTIQLLLRPRPAEIQEDKIVTILCTNASIGVWSLCPCVGSQSVWSYVTSGLTARGCVFLNKTLFISTRVLLNMASTSPRITK
jgi:hypothetical protein